MLDIAPAVDLAEHRSEPRVRRAAASRAAPAPDKGRGDTAIRGWQDGAVVPSPSRRFRRRAHMADAGQPVRGEAQLLDSEAEQGSLARAGAAGGGGQQQQGAVAQPGGVAWTGGGELPQLGRAGGGGGGTACRGRRAAAR